MLVCCKRWLIRARLLRLRPVTGRSLFGRCETKNSISPGDAKLKSGGWKNMYNKVSTDMNFVEREKEVEKFWKENDTFR
ncbi:MAG: hypothetical protein K2P27_06945, partial [Lachnospiraceae bacterium]|nr:hypothetical protein [Lachnospiraceae bacterium]